MATSVTHVECRKFCSSHGDRGNGRLWVRMCSLRIAKDQDPQLDPQSFNEFIDDLDLDLAGISGDSLQCYTTGPAPEGFSDYPSDHSLPSLFNDSESDYSSSNSSSLLDFMALFPMIQMDEFQDHNTGNVLINEVDQSPRREPHIEDYQYPEGRWEISAITDGVKVQAEHDSMGRLACFAANTASIEQIERLSYASIHNSGAESMSTSALESLPNLFMQSSPPQLEPMGIPTSEFVYPMFTVGTPPTPPPTPPPTLPPPPPPDVKKHICIVCSRRFKTRWNLKTHRETHLPNREKRYVCTNAGCRYACARKNDLKRHATSCRRKA